MRPLALVLLVFAFVAGCPSQECRDYVACQLAYDDSVNVDRYQEGGVCWGSLQASQLCTAQCREALAALAEVPSPPPECTVE